MKSIAPVLAISLATVSTTVNAGNNNSFHDNLQADNLYFNAGFTRLKFKSNSEEFVISDIGPAAQLAIEEGPVAGSGASVQGDTQPTLTIGYRFKRYPRLSIETAIAPPFEFSLGITGTARDESLAPYALCPAGSPVTECVETGIPPLGDKLGTVQALPAVLTLLYTLPATGRFQPYAGLGVTWVYTFDSQVTNRVLTEDGQPTLDIETEVSPLLQLGLNTRLSRRWTLVTDVKIGREIKTRNKISNISLVSPALSDVVGPASVGSATNELTLDATVFTAALRYKF